jgi:hypothetical protein
MNSSLVYRENVSFSSQAILDMFFFHRRENDNSKGTRPVIGNGNFHLGTLYTCYEVSGPSAEGTQPKRDSVSEISET